MRSFIIGVLLFTSLVSAAQGNQINLFAQADSLFSVQQWSRAIPLYENFLVQDTANSLEWNRLGYSYQNVGKFEPAIHAYQKSLQNNPSPYLKALVQVRMAGLYANKNQKEAAIQVLTSAVEGGYANVTALNNDKNLQSLHNDTAFKVIVQKAWQNAYPCITDKRTADFDFWLGEWDVYQTGTNNLVGKSRVEKVSGGCMVLENWTAIGVEHNGKSMNFVDPETGKWTQMWVGSAGINNLNITRFYNGEYKDGAMRFEFNREIQGKKTIGRFIFYNQGPEQVRQFNETSNDNGNTWTTSYDFTYKRRKE